MDGLRQAGLLAAQALEDQLANPHGASTFEPLGNHRAAGFCRTCADQYCAMNAALSALRKAGCLPDRTRSTVPEPQEPDPTAKVLPEDQGTADEPPAIVMAREALRQIRAKTLGRGGTFYDSKQLGRADDHLTELLALEAKKRKKL